MIFSLRPFLVIFLVLLQFIAPLVHAHTSEKILSQGLHIPGLEVYGRSASQDTFDSIPSVNTLLCKASSFCSNIDGQIVGINAGLSRDNDVAIQKFYKIIANLDHSHYLPPAATPFKTVVSLSTRILQTQAVPLVCQLAYAAHSPRAPPTHA